jgi:hypothetical protein
MIHVFGIQRVMAFVRSGPRKSPPAPDTQVDGDRDTSRALKPRTTNHQIIRTIS